MAKRAINLSKTITYELDSDPDKGTDEATKWTLGALDARIMSVIKDKATAIPVSAFSNAEGAMASLNINQTNFDVVVFGLKGWSNFLDDENKQVEYKTTTTQLGGKSYLTVDPNIVARIHEDDIAELASAIMEINTPTEDERKNSAE